MRKNIPPQEVRTAEHYQLLELLSHLQLPVVCSMPEDVHRVLALRSAALVEAEMEPTELLRTGERRIASARVTAITPDGRNALARKVRRADHLAPPSRVAASTGVPR